MSRELSSTTKKIIVFILFFGILGFIIQVIGVMRRDDNVGKIKIEKEVVLEEIRESIDYTLKPVS